MRTSVFVGTSLDGFLARKDDALDFLEAGHGEPHGYEEFIASVDAVVIGRRTYEVVLGFGRWPYPKRLRVVVLSRRPLAPAPKGAVVERMSGPPAAIVEKLAASGVTHAYVDGGLTIQRFLRAGLIDRLVVTRLPVLIGSGIPLFGPLEKDVPLRHAATRTFASGLVQSEYEAVSARPSSPPSGRPSSPRVRRSRPRASRSPRRRSRSS